MTQAPPAPDWLKDIVPLPAARDTHPVVRARALRCYLDPAAAAVQADWDEKALALFRGTTGPVDLMAISGEVYARANFNRVLDGKPLVHHLIDRRDLDALLMLIGGNTEAGPMISREDTDMQGLPALEYAISQGWDEGARYLENYGFRLRPANEYKAVNNHQVRVDKIAAHVMEATHAHDHDIFRAALRLGANPNRMIRSDLSLLQMAVLRLKTPLVQALLEAGADIHQLHRRGETILQLMWWCHMPQPLGKEWRETVAILIAGGADQTGFKLPEEMSDAELFQPMAGAPDGARMIDIAVRAGDYATYSRGLMQMGDQVETELLTPRSTMAQSPLESLYFSDRLDIAFAPAIWRGNATAMRRVWAAIAERALKPNRWRDNKVSSFTTADFARAHAQVQQAALAAKAPRHLRLGPRR